MTRGLVTKGIQIKADADGNLPDEIELLHVGNWNAPYHGDWEHTQQDMREYVQHFTEGVGLVETDKQAHVNYGHERGKAAAWITSLFTKDNDTRLWGKVGWTPKGREAVLAGEYKYISPEFNPRSYPWQDPENELHFVPNVLTAAALTNEPLHKKLKPVMASAVPPKKPDAGSSGKHNEGDDMDLQAILAKKAEERTEEEKTFLEEHKAELTVEQRKDLGLETDEEKAAREEEEQKAQEEADRKKAEEEEDEKKRVEASQKGSVTISAAELATLRASAKAGQEAAARLDQKEAEEIADRHIKAGRIKSDQRTNTVKMLLASSGDARKNLESFFDTLPVNQILASEQGSSNARDVEVAVTDDERKLASSFGLTEQDIAEFKKSQANQ